MTKVIQKNEKRILQGDILKNISYLQRFKEEKSTILCDIIRFPKVIVLSQDCDLEKEYNNRPKEDMRLHHHYLISVLLAPAYNAADVYDGKHLERLGITTKPINSKQKNYVESNREPRYHYMEFDRKELNISPLIIDFKHFFTININLIEAIKNNIYLGTIAELHRELLSQRFAFFLSRIGIPNQNIVQEKNNT